MPEAFSLAGISPSKTDSAIDRVVKLKQDFANGIRYFSRAERLVGALEKIFNNWRKGDDVLLHI
jgi:hypothetical protein